MTYFNTILCFLIILFSSSVIGNNFAVISDIGASAQAIAIGNIDGSSRSANAIFSNPAGLYRVHSYSLSLFQTTIMNEIDYLNIALCKNTKFGKIGLGYYSATVDNIPFTGIHPKTNEFYVKEQFTYNNLVTKLAYQKQLTRRLQLGLNLTKYKVQFHDVKAEGYGVDFGILRIFKYFTLSTYVQNINKGTINYKDASDDTYNSSETAPLSVSSSLRIILWNFIVYPQLKYQQNFYLPSLGIQYNPGFLPFLKFNVGYRELLDYTSQKHSRASLGFDLKLLNLMFHYAYERSDYILHDHISYFSLTYDFKFKDPAVYGNFKLSSLLFLIPASYLLML